MELSQRGHTLLGGFIASGARNTANMPQFVADSGVLLYTQGVDTAQHTESDMASPIVGRIVSLYRKKWFRAIVVIAVWGFVSMFFTIQSYMYRVNAGVPDTRLMDLFPRESMFFLLWAAFTPIVVRAARKYPFSRDNWVKPLLMHAAFGLIVAFAQRMIDEGIELNLDKAPGALFPWQTFWNHTLGFTDYGYFLYCIIILVVQAFDISRKLYAERVTGARLREELALAQVSALKMQLQPHFLFNTLNTISILIREEPSLAEQTVQLLSDLLRLTLQQSGEQEISLRREMEFVQKYLEIEKIRFGDRLSVTVNVPAGLGDASVPALILQPLAENAIRHGIAKRREAGRIDITAERRDGMLLLVVEDNGVGIDTPSDGSGIGLTNTRSRLNVLYGDSAIFELRPGRNGGTAAHLSIPLRTVVQRNGHED